MADMFPPEARPFRLARLGALLPALAALIAILPLLRDGVSCGHDFNFHLLSWFEAARQIAQGDLHPHWATLPAWGAGEPRFVFYPPLSWTLGALLVLGLEHVMGQTPAVALASAPIAFTWIALTGAGLAMFHLARRYTSDPVAMLAATIYLVNPYLLFTAYERTAYGELLAAVWLPLLLSAVLPDGSGDGAHWDGKEPEPATTRVVSLAVALALVWLTNAPAAVLGSYSVALVVIVRLAIQRKQPREAARLARSSIAGALLGLALAGFYLLPAIHERPWVEVGLALVPGLRISDNTLFHHTFDQDHDVVLHTASLVSLTLLAMTAVALAGAWLRSAAGLRLRLRLRRSVLLPVTLLFVAAAAMLTRPSLPVWRFVPELAFLQFPWRLLAIVGVLLGLALALALRQLPLNRWAAAGLSLALAAGFSQPFARQFTQPCERGGTPADLARRFETGTGVEPTDEYTPEPADNDVLHPGSPPFWLGDRPDEPAPKGATGPAPRQLTLVLKRPEDLILNLRDFPAWQVTVNGRSGGDRPQRDDGLLTIPLPAGEVRVTVRERLTPDHIAGDLLSVAALAIMAVLSFGGRLRRRGRSPESGRGPAGALL